MKDESKFVIFSPNGGRIEETGHMSRLSVYSIVKKYKERCLLDVWMQAARRGEFYNCGAMVILCVSGRRRLSKGTTASLLQSLVSGGVR